MRSQHTGSVAANGGSYSVSTSSSCRATSSGRTTSSCRPIRAAVGRAARQGLRGRLRGQQRDRRAAAGADRTAAAVGSRRRGHHRAVERRHRRAGDASTFTVRNKSGATAERLVDRFRLPVDRLRVGSRRHPARQGRAQRRPRRRRQLHLDADRDAAAGEGGAYRIIVRTDIFNQVFEGVDERNNTTASAARSRVTVPELQLGVPPSTTLSPGEQRLYKVTVGANETLSVALDAADDLSAERALRPLRRRGQRLRVRLRRAAGALGRPEHAGARDAGRRLLRPDQGRSGSGRHHRDAHSSRRCRSASPTSPSTRAATAAGSPSRSPARASRQDALVKLVRPGIEEVEPANASPSSTRRRSSRPST